MKNRKILQEYKSKLRSNLYAPNTVSTYVQCATPFLSAFESKDLEEVSEKEVAQFFIRYGLEKQISESYKRHMLTAVKKLYLLVFNREVELGRVSKSHLNKVLFPTHIEKLEIKRMIKSSTNLKHQCIIGLLYSAGMRLEELINLKNSAIDFRIHQIRITNPKTNKQRTIPLSPFLVPHLKSYKRSYTNERPVFKGYKNSFLCPRAIQHFVRNAARLADIEQSVTPTILRNSFAIHLLQVGTKAAIVQKLMGLESEQSMQKYIFMANQGGERIRSPLD